MEEEPLSQAELERLVDNLFERTDARTHAIMHEIARLAVSQLLIDSIPHIMSIEGDA